MVLLLIMDKAKLIKKVLNPYFEAELKSIIYRFRFLGMYIIFGFLSIIIELIFRRYLISLSLPINFSTVIAITLGIICAFYLNIKFNFKIPKTLRNRAFIYFFIISILSGCLQLLGKNFILFETSNFYEIDRLIVSGSVFIIAYIFHRKLSFKDYKKVGVAIYANGLENIEKIYNEIGHYSDFIHVDIIDKTILDNAEEVKTYRMEAIKAYWNETKIHAHIMSKKPSKWIDQVLPYSDIVFIHSDSNENIKKEMMKIKRFGKKAGLAITLKDDLNESLDLLKFADAILLLTIPKIGMSGQKFDDSGLNKIKEINLLPFRNKFLFCIDGGVNEKNVHLLEAENIVSGSSVLNHIDPKKQIMRLQTMNRYEQI